MNALTGLQKKTLVSLLIFGISLLHFTTGIHHSTYHVIHRELFLIPIVLAAYWFGKKGGLAVSLISSVLFLPWAFHTAHVSTQYHINNVLQVLTFNGVAYLLGMYRDANKAKFTTFWRPNVERLGPSSEERNVLVCIDNSENALKTARYVVDNFSKDGKTSVTILGFVREPQEDLFAKPEEYREACAENDETLAALLRDARIILQEGGFAPETLNVKTIKLKNESIGNRILDEQQNTQFSSIVVGGSKMSRTEEFIFGNLAVKLVREANCPIVTVF